MRAFLALRPGVHYRRDAFAAGLTACGFSVIEGLPTRARPGDVLVIWNRYRESAQAAHRFEDAGLSVLVAENGYLGNDFAGGRWYALARNQHNGAGSFPEGSSARWDGLGVTLAPFRESGGEVVLLPQRGIGPPGVAMPAGWAERTLERLWRAGIKARIRPHPGTAQCRELLDDLAHASAVVTWGSGAALKALAAGVPAFSDWGEWIGAGAALPVSELLHGRYCRDASARLAMFRRLAWAQWRLPEIASGSAFLWLLNRGR